MAERQAEREASGDDAQSYVGVIHKQRPIEVAKPDAVKPMTQPTDDWVRYIKQQLDKRERTMDGAIADVVAIETKARQTLEAEHAVTRQELLALKGELAELRGELKTRAALADMEARLARMETTPTPARLRTVV